MITEITNLLESKKCDDIKAINVGGKTSIAQYMVIASCTSGRHLYAISQHLKEQAKETGNGIRVDGKPDQDWIVVEYGDVLIHLFKEDARAHYKLEEFWENDITCH